MSKTRARLKIELQSDLCVGSGYAYAGVIDSDVTYDDYGIPFIPARRLKGCLREAAELICPSEVETVFGKRGDDAVKGIVLGNACIENYHEIAKELRSLSGRKDGAAVYLSSQNILGMYTSVRSQTKIDVSTGAAADNSLRFIRVVNQYNPLDPEKNLCFFADIEYDDAWQEQIEKIVKATRNLGMNRNRGLGSVRCTLTDQSPEEAKKVPAAIGKGGKVCLTYILHNEKPLLLSSDSNDVSDSYISGKSILGRLAGEYLRQPGHDADSEEFSRLFLDGTTVFTNANLTFAPKKNHEDASAWPSYYPAPFYLNKMKKSKALVNQIRQDLAEDKLLLPDYNSGDGNLPKKLKTQYVCEVAPNAYYVAEAERELIFHNSRKDELLYSAEVLKEGQYFKGKIYTDWEYASLLAGLLENQGLSFGKSKTAQYGTCKLAEAVKTEDAECSLIRAEAGEKIVVTLCSDAVFLNEHGYTVIYDEVKEIIARNLSICYEQGEDAGSVVQTKEVTGYHTKWNLKRQAVPAVKAGSAFVYTIASGSGWESPKDTSKRFVGERNLEGYGEVCISEYNKMSYAVKQCKVFKAQPPIEMTFCRPFLSSIVKQEMLNELTYRYISRNGKGQGLKMSPSTVGRITLMLKESLNECRNDPEKAFQNFCIRINSIQRKAEKEEAFDLLQKVLVKSDLLEEKYQIDTEKMLEAESGSSLVQMKEVLWNYFREEYNQQVIGIWGDYVNNILIYHKYLKKDGQNRAKDGK